jgi:hypothetical protein
VKTFWNLWNNQPMELKDAFIEVWRQALVEEAQSVQLGPESFPVRKTAKQRLRQVDFVFEQNGIRGLEQNPETKSEWARMARSGKKVMQFLMEDRHIANVADGKVTFYNSQT